MTPYYAVWTQTGVTALQLSHRRLQITALHLNFTGHRSPSRPSHCPVISRGI